MLKEKLQPYFCQQDKAPSRQSLWQIGIFDSTIQSQIIRPKAKATISLSTLKDAASAVASHRSHRGFAYGICQDGKAWIISTPAPAPVSKVDQEGKVRLDLGSTKSYCSIVRVDFAPSGNGTNRHLYHWPKKDPWSPQLSINSRFLPSGTLSLTCKPKHKNLGYELWSLQATSKGELPLPRANLIQGQSGLQNWINHMRKDYGLMPLKTTSKALESSSQKLASRYSTLHNRQEINQVRSWLTQQNFEFLGENRVLADSPQEMAWLLWHSPRHRALLLRKDATHLALTARSGAKDQLAVIVVAKSNMKP